MGCNHNFVTYQNCGESNVTASKNKRGKSVKPAPKRLARALAGTPTAKRTILHADCGGTAALGPAGSLAWEGEGMAPGYHWRLIGMVFCGCFFVFSQENKQN